MLATDGADTPAKTAMYKWKALFIVHKQQLLQQQINKRQQRQPVVALTTIEKKESKYFTKNQ